MLESGDGGFDGLGGEALRRGGVAIQAWAIRSGRVGEVGLRQTMEWSEGSRGKSRASAKAVATTSKFPQHGQCGGPTLDRPPRLWREDVVVWPKCTS
mgnify:CR=1